jgi:hypothetical protein
LPLLSLQAFFLALFGFKPLFPSLFDLQPLIFLALTLLSR